MAQKGLKKSIFHLRKNIGTEGVKTIYVSSEKKILALKGLKQSVFHGTEVVKTFYVLSEKKMLALKLLKQSLFHLRKKYWY